MGALPKKKLTRSRQGSRMAQKNLTYSLTACPQCRRAKLPHRACPHCGYYRGREVIKIETETGRQG